MFSVASTSLTRYSDIAGAASSPRTTSVTFLAYRARWSDGLPGGVGAADDEHVAPARTDASESVPP